MGSNKKQTNYNNCLLFGQCLKSENREIFFFLTVLIRYGRENRRRSPNVINIIKFKVRLVIIGKKKKIHTHLSTVLKFELDIVTTPQSLNNVD